MPSAATAVYAGIAAEAVSVFDRGDEYSIGDVEYEAFDDISLDVTSRVLAALSEPDSEVDGDIVPRFEESYP
jgi:hypothetical protein